MFCLCVLRNRVLKVKAPVHQLCTKLSSGVLTVGPGNAASSDGSHYPGFWMWDSGWREKSPAPETKKRFVLHTLGTQTLPFCDTIASYLV